MTIFGKKNRSILNTRLATSIGSASKKYLWAEEKKIMKRDYGTVHKKNHEIFIYNSFVELSHGEICNCFCQKGLDFGKGEGECKYIIYCWIEVNNLSEYYIKL